MGVLSDNLKRLKIKKPFKQKEIAAFVGVTVSTWSNYEIGKTEPTNETLVKISKFFRITVDELLKEGNPFEETFISENQQKGNVKGNLTRNLNTVNEAAPVYNRVPKVVTVDSTGIDNVVMVPLRARAGYLAGYGDPEFIQSLPTYRLPGLTHGTYRMFEIYGQSMVPTYHESDIVISRFVENLNEIRDDRVYIVVTQRDGVVAKRVINRVHIEGKLILNSDNQRHPGEYPPIVVNPEEVLEIWYAVAFLSRQMRKPGEIYNRLNDVESRVTILEEELRKSRKKN